MREQTLEDMRYILDTFTGADGGVQFVKFHNMVEQVDKQAEAGDADSQKLVAIIKQFTNFIKVANKA